MSGSVYFCEGCGHNVYVDHVCPGYREPQDVSVEANTPAFEAENDGSSPSRPAKHDASR